MNNIMRKTFELLDVLDRSRLILELDECKKRISSNRELTELINKGNSTEDSYLLLDIKRKLYKNSDYKNYIDKYNELMYIVMYINSRYSKMLGKGSCFR